jgi:hypothetical protein
MNLLVSTSRMRMRMRMRNLSNGISLTIKIIISRKVRKG